jgi:hypothetical protein
MINSSHETISKRPEYPEPHRGRDRLASINDSNRKKIVKAESSGSFWKEIRRLVDPKPVPISVTASN